MVQGRAVDTDSDTTPNEAGRPLWPLAAPPAMATMQTAAREELLQAARRHVDASTAAFKAGDIETAAKEAEHGLEQARLARASDLVAAAQVASAKVSWQVGDNDAALAALEASWTVVQRGDDLKVRFHCENMLGVVYKEIGGQLERSIEWHVQARRTAHEAGDARLEAMAAINVAGRWGDIGDTALESGDAPAARAAWERAVASNDEAFSLLSKIDDRLNHAIVRTNRSGVLVQLGRLDEALPDLEFLRSESRTLKEGDLIVATAVNWTRMHLRLGRVADARREIEAGIAAGESFGVLNALVPALRLASSIAEEQFDLAAALAHFKRMHALHEKTSHERAQSRSRVLAVRLDTERARSDAQEQRNRALQLAQVNDALEQRARVLQDEAMLDSLTGLPNRRRLDQHLAAAHADAHHRHMPLCVALLDLDHFKAINDRFSHAVGDRVLQQFASLLRAQCRDHDLPARWGGEEFVVVLHGIGPARAQQVCDRLRQAIAMHDWPTVAPGLVVTVSVGVCDIGPCATPDEGLAKADTLLYRAKQGGRNRVEA